MCNNEKLSLLYAGIQTAKELNDKAVEARQLIYKALDDLGVDLYSAKTNAKDSENLFEAIFAYICYGEYSIDELMKEIKTVYLTDHLGEC